MPSTQLLPSRDNGYAAPQDMRLIKAVWDAVFGDIDARLRTAEAIRASFQDLIDAGTGQALEFIAANIGPELQSLNAELSSVQAAANNARDTVAQLLSGGVPAENVGTNAGHRFITDAQLALVATALQPSDEQALQAQVTAATNAATAALTAAASGLKLSTRTANTPIAATDFGSMIDITPATNFIQTFGAPGTLGAGSFFLKNSHAANTITLTPTAPAKIDTLASFIMYPGEMRLITSDGTANFTSRVVTPFLTTITTSGSFVWPPGYLQFEGLGWGGGGGGYGQAAGGGAPCTPFSIPAASVTLGASTSAVVGAGGASNAAGGATTLGTFLNAAGGSTSPNGTAAGPATLAFPGAVAVPMYDGAAGGTSGVWGGGGGGSGTSQNTLSPGGLSSFGGAGGRSGTNSPATAASPGSAPGGGGGGGYGVAGGAGARGEIRIRGVI